MNPQQPNAPDPKTRVSNILPVTEPGERTVCVIKRHPVGLFGVYGTCALVLLITAVLAFIVLPAIVGVLVFIVVLAISAVFAWIAATVYWGNSWTVTSDSLTQVSRTGLFSRQSSQLSLQDLEDVTAQQNGMLAGMLNFGVLRVETAGESSKFMFPYCPNPNYYAQQILKAREVFEQNRRAEEGAYQPAPAYQAPVAAPAAQPVPQPVPQPAPTPPAPAAPVAAAPAAQTAPIQPQPAPGVYDPGKNP